MPTVPTYDTPQVAPAGLPNAQIQGLSPRALMQGEIGGHEMEGAGQAAINYGTGELNADAKEQMMANQVRVDAALNNVRARQQKLTYDPETGFLNQMGQAAIKPNAQGQGLQDQFGQKLQSAISDESDGLANDAQRQVFARQAAPLATSFEGQIQSHVLQEYKKVGLETQQGTIDLASDAAQKNWSNPEEIDQQIASVKSAVWKAGQLLGEPANLTDAKTLQTTSGIHSGVINAALQNNNPAYAQQYIQRYKGDMTAGDLLKASGSISTDLVARTATSAAQTAMAKFLPSFAPSSTDRMLQITRQAESGGQDTKADGTPVTSSAGAKYGMQVMPATAANPGFGIKPAASDSPAEYNRVGTQLLGAMVQKYAGDSAKAWAAYNAGPGNVDSAIKDAGPGGDWMTALAQYQSPANHVQTLAYVQNNVKQLQSGGGVPPMPSLQDIHQNIRSQLGPNADPQTLSKALAEGGRQYSDALKDRATQADNAVQGAQQYLAQNGGDFNSLPPDLHAQVVALAPDKLPGLQTFANAIAKPPVVDDSAAYHRIFDHPEAYTNLPESEFQKLMVSFTPATQKELQSLRDKNVAGERALDVANVNQIMYNRLGAAGIVKPMANDATGQARVGTIQKYLADSILDQQKVIGRQMNYGEMDKFIDAQFRQSAVLKSFYGGSSTVALLSEKIDDLPDARVDALKGELQAAGVASPSSDDILRYHWHQRQAGK